MATNLSERRSFASPIQFSKPIYSTEVNWEKDLLFVYSSYYIATNLLAMNAPIVAGIVNWSQTNQNFLLSVILPLSQHQIYGEPIRCNSDIN